MDKEHFYSYLENTDLLNAETVDEMKKLTIDYPWFQAAWMLYLKNLQNLNTEGSEKVLKKVAIRVPNRKLLFKFLNSEIPRNSVSIEKLKSASSVYRLEGDNNLPEGNSLIDRFLTTEPGIIKRKNAADDLRESNEDKKFAERSVAENDEIITETLAAIYFQQKNYEKAQEAYQKLSLKYPEKSVYFATRIKEIEKLKNI